MVIDTSAVIAIVFGESERAAFAELLLREPVFAIPAAILYESSVVAFGKKQNAGILRVVDDLIRDLEVEIVALDVQGALAAREAYFRFGRGYHPAQLNLADCFSYSLAKTRNEPLLFKGNDFSKTDIIPAWSPR